MKERLLRFLNHKSLSSSEFADILGVQRSSISHIMAGRNKPSYDFIEKMMNSFPDLNIEWLVQEKGNMIKGDTGPMAMQVDGTNSIGLFERTVTIQEPLPPIVSENETTVIEKSVKHRKNPAKQITRIVIFYSDHTFTEYSPEK